jgi:hypothetical protein
VSRRRGWVESIPLRYRGVGPLPPLPSHKKPYPLPKHPACKTTYEWLFLLAAGKGAPKLGKKEIGTLSAPTAKHEGALVWDVGSWVSKNTESLDWMKPSDPWGQPRWGYEQKAVDSPGVWIGRVKMPKGTESWLLSLAV